MQPIALKNLRKDIKHQHHQILVAELIEERVVVIVIGIPSDIRMSYDKSRISIGAVDIRGPKGRENVADLIYVASSKGVDGVKGICVQEKRVTSLEDEDEGDVKGEVSICPGVGVEHIVFY
jgi:hypothetical protein